MTDEQHILRLIQSHKSLDYFDYSIAVKLAIELIQKGNETDNTLMLASFSEPIDRLEISPYVTDVLNEIGLEELDYENAIIAKTHFHLTEILNNNEIRKNLHSLYELCLDNDYELGLMNFYLVYHAWDELETMGVNYYFDGADLDNIESELKIEAKKWINKYINGIEVIETNQELIEQQKKLPEISKTPRKGLIAKLKNLFS